MRHRLLHSRKFVFKKPPFKWKTTILGRRSCITLLATHSATEQGLERYQHDHNHALELLPQLEITLNLRKTHSIQTVYTTHSISFIILSLFYHSTLQCIVQRERAEDGGWGRGQLVALPCLFHMSYFGFVMKHSSWQIQRAKWAKQVSWWVGQLIRKKAYFCSNVLWHRLFGDFGNSLSN